MNHFTNKGKFACEESEPEYSKAALLRFGVRSSQ
jgi:hypothetical protein